MAKITALEFDHEWTNSFGTMYDFNISFDDGRSGQVSAKSQNPSYKVGDEVEVEVKRQTEHGMVFKVSKGGFKQGTANGNQRPAGAPPRGGYVAKDNSFDIRIGRCMILAKDIWLSGKVKDKPIVDIADKLFKDELELIKRNAPAPASQPAHPQQRQATPQPQAQQEPPAAQEPEEDDIPW